MRRILHLAWHDLRLFILAKENIFFMFIMPVMFMLFFSVVLRSGGGGAKVQISLQVVNQDSGFMGEAFLDQLRGEQFDLSLLDHAAANTTDYIRRLVIPADFTTKLLALEQVELDFTKRSDSSVEYDAAADVRLHQAQVAFLGALIRWDHPTATEPVTAEDQSKLLALIGEQQQVTLAESYAGTGRPVPSGAGQSVPGMVTMFVIMIVMIGGSESLTGEKLHGTLARLATTTFSRSEIIAGKLMYLNLVGFVQASVLIAAGEVIGRTHLFGIDFSWGPDWWVVVLFAIPFAFTVAGLTLFLGGLFRTTQQAESLGWLIGMVFSALGGCWWPMEIMPRSAQLAAHVFPTYWSMRGLHGVVTFGHGLDAIVLPTVVLLGMGLVLAWLGARTMRVAT